MKDIEARKTISELKFKIQILENQVGWLEGFISFHYFFDQNKRHPPLPHDLKTWSIPQGDKK